MNNWRQIWEKDQRINNIILECLIKADGFDSVASGFSVDDWLAYTDHLHRFAKIRISDSVFEVGCGSCAFIYPLYLKGHRVGGLDYSAALIQLARKFLDKGDFINLEATFLNTADQYDVVLSHSVFHYFNDPSYARSVIELMAQKSRRAVAILDVNDADKRDEYHRVRRGTMSKAEYKDKYQGLDHQFYDKSWFKELATDLGYSIIIEDQQFENYSNSKLRFNVLMEM